MAAIFQTTSSNAFSQMKMYEFAIKISPKFVPKGLMDSKSALVHEMDLRQTGTKPLAVPMMAKITETYVHHQAWLD